MEIKGKKRKAKSKYSSWRGLKACAGYFFAFCLLPFAGLKRRTFISPQLRGSILLESIISMIIVMTCFGVGITIYANVLSTDNNRLRLRAQLVLEETAITTKNEKRFLSETFEAEPLKIIKIVSPYAPAPGVQLLHLEAYDSEGKKLAERNELITP